MGEVRVTGVLPEFLVPDVYFEVEGVNELATQLRTNGAKILRRAEVAPYGTKELEAEDLHGYVLCFGEDVGDPGGSQSVRV